MVNTIRLLTQQDCDIVKAFLNKDPLHNIYSLHGLQTYGLESKYVTFWGVFSTEQLEGILFANNESKPRFACVASENPAVLALLGEFALKSEQIKQWVGKSTYIEPAIKHLTSHFNVNIRRFNFFEAHPEQFEGRYDYPVRVATEEDIPLMVELYKEYEFSRKNRTDMEVEHEIRQEMNESGIYFVLDVDGRIVSACRVFPEIEQCGMVGGARTLPEFRGHGMHPSVRTACYEYLFKQKKIGINYSLETNTSIHKVLDKLGVSLTAQWLIVRFKKRPPLRRRIVPLRLRRWLFDKIGRV